MEDYLNFPTTIIAMFPQIPPSDEQNSHGTILRRDEEKKKEIKCD